MKIHYSILLFICTLISVLNCTKSNKDSQDSNTTERPVPASALSAVVVSFKQVNLSWTDNSVNETGFIIERKTAAGTFLKISTTAENTALYSDTGLTANTSYTYRVISFNNAGNAPSYSNEVIVNTPTSPPPLPDSVLRLNYVLCAGTGSGESFFYEYDSTGSLVKFYMPYGWAINSPCYVFYKNGRPDYIISDYKDPNYGVKKASMILVYGPDNKCSKVYYKPRVSGYTNSSPYFSDLNDGRVYAEYDSLTYTPSKQLEHIYHVNAGIPVLKIKFFYPGSADSNFNKLEYYLPDLNGNLVLNDQIAVTPGNFENLFFKNQWYFCFVNDLGVLSGIGTMSLPIFLDQPSTYLKRFFSFAQRLPAEYTVTNNWGYYNLHSSYSYSYNADSTIFTASKPGDPTGITRYYFKKYKR